MKEDESCVEITNVLEYDKVSLIKVASANCSQDAEDWWKAGKASQGKCHLNAAWMKGVKYMVTKGSWASGGEHTIEYADVNYNVEIYIMLLTNTFNFKKKEKIL